MLPFYECVSVFVAPLSISWWVGGSRYPSIGVCVLFPLVTYGRLEIFDLFAVNRFIHKRANSAELSVFRSFVLWLLPLIESLVSPFLSMMSPCSWAEEIVYFEWNLSGCEWLCAKSESVDTLQYLANDFMNTLPFYRRFQECDLLYLICSWVLWLLGRLIIRLALAD